jgi:thiol-disulfide isomerase/thioredoxin
MQFLKKIENMFKSKDAMRNTLLLIGGILVVVFLVNHLNKVKEGMANGGKDKECVYFHMNGCPHCVDMMPEWDKFVENNNKDENSSVSTKKVEASEESALRDKLGVNGYPTVYLVNKQSGDPIAEFKGDRTFQGLRDFIQEHTQ